MSDVEKYYERIRQQWPGPTRPWSQLNQMEQMQVVQSINFLLAVLK